MGLPLTTLISDAGLNFKDGNTSKTYPPIR